MHPIRRRQRRLRRNLPGPEGLARRGASAALHGLPVVTTTGGAARLASAPSPCQRGSRGILRQAPRIRVLLVDDHAVVREGYRRLLERDESLAVVGEAAAIADALTLDAPIP